MIWSSIVVCCNRLYLAIDFLHDRVFSLCCCWLSHDSFRVRLRVSTTSTQASRCAQRARWRCASSGRAQEETQERDKQMCATKFRLKKTQHLSWTFFKFHNYKYDSRMEGRQGCGKINLSISNSMLYDKCKMCEQGAAKQICWLILEILFCVKVSKFRLRWK